MKSVGPLSARELYAVATPRFLRGALSLAIAMTTTMTFGCATAVPLAPKVEAPKSVSIEAEPAKVETEARAPVPLEARSLAFAYIGAKGDATLMRASDAVRASLVRAGYWIVDSNGPSDARIEVHVKHAAPSSSGLLGTQIRPADGSDAEVSLTVMDGQERIEWLLARIETKDVTSKGVDDFVDRLSGSPRFAAFAESAAKKKAEHGVVPRAASAGASRVTTSESMALRDEDAWSESAVRRCRNDRRKGACYKVREYLAKFPEGAHAANAKAALALSAHGDPSKTTGAAE